MYDGRKKEEKMMTTRMWCLLFFGCVSMCLSPSIIRAETIRFATIDYCPFTCDPAKEEGREGVMTDVLREAFERAGHTLEITMLPYVRAVKSVQDGEYDGIVVVGKDYAPDLVYPDRPTVVQRVAFVVNAGSPWRYEGVESLFHVIVGIVKGYHYVDPGLVTYLEEEQNNEARVNVLHGNNTTKRAFLMLLSGRIDTFLEGEYTVMYELKNSELREKVMIAGYTTKAFEDYSGFSPHNPNADQYAQLLSDTIIELKQSGKLDDILRNYGITAEQKP